MFETKYEIVQGDDIAVTAFKVPDGKTKETDSSSTCRWVGKVFLLLTAAVIILCAIFAAAVYTGGRHFFDKMGQAVVPRITVDRPLNLPTVRLPKSELDALRDRMDYFHDALRDGEVLTEDLVLTEREINGLICSNHDICGKIYATISKDMVSADFSFPAEDAPGGKGRFFVGTKSLIVAPLSKYDSSYFVQWTIATRGLDVWDDEFPLVNITSNVVLNDEVDVRIKSSEVLGWKATDAFVRRFFDGKNWADDMCPHAKRLLKQVEGVTIGDGIIVVHFYGADAVAAGGE
jgi:hypothetical protein